MPNLDRLTDMVLKPHTIGAEFRTGALYPYPDGDYSQKVGNDVWRFHIAGGKATVTGGPTNHVQYAIPGMLGGCQVVSIGDSAFEGSDGTYHLPNSITNIGKRAFYKAGTEFARLPSSLTRIGKDAYRECRGLTSVTFPSGLLEIDDGAFYNCSLVSVVLSSSIRRIGKEAFRCSGNEGPISEVVINSATNLVIEEKAFYYNDVDKIWISGNDIVIGDSAFMQNSWVSEKYNRWWGYDYDVRLTGENIQVGDYAFADMQHLQTDSAVIDLSGVSSIGLYAFRKYGLYYFYDSHRWRDRVGSAELRISSQLKHCDAKAFRGAYFRLVKCEKYTDILEKDGLLRFSGPAEESYGEYSGYLYYLSVAGKLVTEITVPESMSDIRDCGFCHVSVSSITVPEGVRRIGAHAFYECCATNLVVSDSVEEIGEYAFRANGMRSFSWPIRVTQIPTGAFYGCEYLASITIPNSVTNIGGSAFYWCENLATVKVERGDADRVRQMMAASGVDVSKLNFVTVEFVNVSFDLGEHGRRTGGGWINQRLEKGASAVSPTVEAQSGWTFEGWDRSLEDIRFDQTLTAIYRPVTYDIIYEGTEGAANPNPTSYTSADEIVFKPLMGGAGKRFVSWTPDRIERGTTGTVSVVAKWDHKTVAELMQGMKDVSSSGYAEWYAEWADGQWVIRSGAIGDDQYTELGGSVSGPGMLTFEWRASSEIHKTTPIDKCELYVDGVWRQTIGGETDWIPCTFELGDGPHRVSWRYSKDVSGFEGQDCTWLRNVK